MLCYEIDLPNFLQEVESDSSKPPCKRPSTDTSACIPDSMLDFSNASASKSPDIFSRMFFVDFSVKLLKFDNAGAVYDALT